MLLNDAEKRMRFACSETPLTMSRSARGVGLPKISPPAEDAAGVLAAARATSCTTAATYRNDSLLPSDLAFRMLVRDLPEQSQNVRGFPAAILSLIPGNYFPTGDVSDSARRRIFFSEEV